MRISLPIAEILLACVAAIAPAAAQQTPPASAAPPPGQKAAPGSDQDFLLGLRRIGVLAGQAVQCMPEANRGQTIDDTVILGNQIAIQFGLTAAFNFIGAVGYGSGKPFDNAGCQQTIASWKSIQQKYLVN